MAGFIFRLLLLLVITTQRSFACECLWQGSFTKASTKADLIVSGKIIASKGNAIDLAIDTTLIDHKKNGQEFNSTIRIWTDTGASHKANLCRPPVTNFPIESQWVMGLKKITTDIDGGFNPNTPNISYGRINDYYLSKCGAYWLELKEGYVTGNLTKGRRWEWNNNSMNPVLLELINAYVNNIIPEKALIEAAKPLTATKKLMEDTKNFIDTQQ